MTDIIKQRLIGALLLLIVIVAVASFLITKASYDNEEQSEVVEEPEFISSIEPLIVDIIESEQEILVDPHQLEKQENNVEVTDKVTDALPTPDSNLAQLWIIQLGSFGVKENAQLLNEKLRKLGFDSKIEHQGTNYRVRIGPEADKQLIDNIAVKISKQFKIKPQILSFKP